MAKNPAKFDRCVTDVQRSLKKAGRAGNAFAICQATRRNPTRWNPLVPLDPTTFLYGPSVLASIEKEREKIARGFTGKKKKTAKRRNLFGFGKKETYHARIVRGGGSGGDSGHPQLVSKFEGKSIYQLPDGDYTTSIDRDSHHDSLADAKAFIKSWKTNKGRKNGPNWRTAGAGVGKQDKAAHKHGFPLRGIRSTFAELWDQAVANGHQNTSAATQRKALASFTAGYDRSFNTRVNAGDYSFRKSKKRMKDAGLYDEMVLRRHSGGDKVKRVPKQFRKHPGMRQNKPNPVPAAQERYASFHGHPSESLTKVRTPLHSHDVLAGIGELRKLKIKSANGRWKVTIKFAKPYPLLAMNEAATQLYIEGGDQSVNVKDFGIHTEHEKQNLGTVTDVYYFTHKDHLRPEDGGTAVYHHKFGKVKPTMVYDVPNQLLEFAGGGYTIPDEGIDQ